MFTAVAKQPTLNEKTGWLKGGEHSGSSDGLSSLKWGSWMLPFENPILLVFVFAVLYGDVSVQKFHQCLPLTA